jgi:dTDP-4-dehydrorhamnose reductase
VTNSGATTWYEFACEIVRQAGIEARVEPITSAEYGAAAPRPRYSVLDTTAYHRLGGPPMPDWKSALAEYFAEWKQLYGSP